MPNQHGEFIWYELSTDNADAAQHFYGAILGWRVTDSGQPNMDYRILHARDENTGEWRPIGGLMALTEEMKQCGARPLWLGYIGVNDVDRAVAKVTELGGSVQMPATDIPDVGRLAMVTDPQGTPFYVMRGNSDEASLAFASDRPREFNVKLADWAENRELTIKRSKAVGEPPFMLGMSTFFALNDALRACGPHDPRLDAPATAEQVLAAVGRARGA